MFEIEELRQFIFNIEGIDDIDSLVRAVVSLWKEGHFKMLDLFYYYEIMIPGGSKKCDELIGKMFKTNIVALYCKYINENDILAFIKTYTKYSVKIPIEVYKFALYNIGDNNDVIALFCDVVNTSIFMHSSAHRKHIINMLRKEIETYDDERKLKFNTLNMNLGSNFDVSAFSAYREFEINLGITSSFNCKDMRKQNEVDPIISLLMFHYYMCYYDFESVRDFIGTYVDMQCIHRSPKIKCDSCRKKYFTIFIGYLPYLEIKMPIDEIFIALRKADPINAAYYADRYEKLI
jgi:hypothetical protein